MNREEVYRGQAECQDRVETFPLIPFGVIKEQHAVDHQRTGNAALRQQPLGVDHPNGPHVSPQPPKADGRCPPERSLVTCMPGSSYALCFVQIQPYWLKPSKLIYVELTLIPLALVLSRFLLGPVNLLFPPSKERG